MGLCSDCGEAQLVKHKSLIGGRLEVTFSLEREQIEHKTHCNTFYALHVQAIATAISVKKKMVPLYMPALGLQV